MSVRDFRLALRALAQAPGFALVAVLTLALGIGASTAIFSVVDAVLLRPLPFPHASQLLAVRESDRQFPSMSVSYPDYLDWVAGNHSFSALAVYRGTGATLTHVGPPQVLAGEDATASYFTVLGIPPELGRTFTAAEDRPGGAPVVVLADALWRSRFHADPSILGRSIDLDAVPRTVIGVMPPGFPGLASGIYLPQFWVPLGAQATAASGLMDRGSHQGLNGLGRLRPGIKPAMARADLERIARALAQRYPKSNARESVSVRSYLAYVVRNSDPAALWMLLVAVGLLLLIGCANVANLMLARATGRQKANAIRAALGASRARLMAGHFAESLCLGVAGGAVGILLALAALRAAPAYIPADVARAQQIALDGRALAFALALALASSVLFGLAPAWRAGRARLADVLKQGGRDTAAASSGGRLRAVLVALEMALAMILLIGAGLLIRSLLALDAVDPGFNPHGALTFEINLPPAKYPTPAASRAFFRQALRRLARLPGVAAVAAANPLPFSGSDWENSFSIVGRPAPPPGQKPSTNYEMISGDYFDAMGIHLLRGRAFNRRDTAASPPVAIVDTMFARQYWPGPDPMTAALGRQIRMDGKNLTIVGVVARVMEYDLDGSEEMDRLPEMFVPSAQAGDANDAYVILRTPYASPLALRREATAAIQSIDPDQPLFDMQTMDQRVAFWLAQRRLTLWLMGAFAALALVLASIGMYGVLNYAVAQRGHELGVRMALGASRGRVLALVLGQGMRLAGAGALIGLAAALALGRFARALLFGVNAADPLTFIAVPLVLLAVAALACYLPALRATRVDPLIALRGE